MFKFEQLVTFHICNIKYQAVVEKHNFRSESNPLIEWRASFHIPPPSPGGDNWRGRSVSGRTQREAVKNLIIAYVMEQTSMASASHKQL